MTEPGHGSDAASSQAPRRRRRPEPTPTQRALGLLTRREHSRKELVRKLADRGVESSEAAVVVDKLTEAGWQDDTRFAQSMVRSRASAGYGPAFIRAALGTHGLGADTIASALEAYEGDWTDNARALVARRHPAAHAGDREAQRRAAEFLLRRGFSMEQARAALHGE